jgi:zinc transporter
MTNEFGLSFAHLLDGIGGSKQLTISDIKQWNKSHGLLWLHFDYTHPDAECWLMEESGLERVIADALVVEESRPRTTVINNGLLMSLRSINHHSEAKAEDMISLRIWIDNNRIITTRRHKLAAAAELNTSLQQGHGPKTAGDFLVKLLDLIVDGMADTISDFEDKMDDFESQILDNQNPDLRFNLSQLRRQVIALRRYLSPQRDALGRLFIEKLSWLSADHHIEIHEVNDNVIRYIENLDAVRERATVTQEELISRVSEQLNTRMYVLSVITAIFLPLGFLTSLFGINVGGIPGSSDGNAFWLFMAFLALIIMFQVIIFKWKKWF